MDKNTYRLMVKNESGRFQPALGEEQDADDGVMTLVMPRKAGE